MSVGTRARNLPGRRVLFPKFFTQNFSCAERSQGVWEQGLRICVAVIRFRIGQATCGTTSAAAFFEHSDVLFQEHGSANESELHRPAQSDSARTEDRCEVQRIRRAIVPAQQRRLCIQQIVDEERHVEAGPLQTRAHVE